MGAIVAENKAESLYGGVDDGIDKVDKELHVGKGRNMPTASFTTIVFGVTMVTKMDKY